MSGIAALVAMATGHPLMAALFFANSVMDKKYPEPDPIDQMIAYEEKKEKLTMLFARQFCRWAFDTDRTDMNPQECCLRWNLNHGDLLFIRDANEYNTHLSFMTQYWHTNIYQGPR